jgi:hypothetical protein
VDSVQQTVNQLPESEVAHLSSLPRRLVEAAATWAKARDIESFAIIYQLQEEFI